MPNDIKLFNDGTGNIRQVPADKIEKFKSAFPNAQEASEEQLNAAENERASINEQKRAESTNVNVSVPTVPKVDLTLSDKQKPFSRKGWDGAVEISNAHHRSDPNVQFRAKFGAYKDNPELHRDQDAPEMVERKEKQPWWANIGGGNAVVNAIKEEQYGKDNQGETTRTRQSQEYLGRVDKHNRHKESDKLSDFLTNTESGRDAVAYDKKLDTYFAELKPKLEQQIAELEDEVTRKSTERRKLLERGVAGTRYGVKQSWLSDEEKEKIKQAKQKDTEEADKIATSNDLQQASETLKEMKMMRDAVSDRDANAFKQFYNEFGRRMPQALFDIGTLGVKEIFDAAAPQETGRLTDKADDLFANYQHAISNLYKHETSMAQDIANGGLHTLGFMAQMAATGGIATGIAAGATKGVGKALLKEGARKFITKSTAKGVGKVVKIAGKNISEAFVQTVLMPSTLAGALEKNAEQPGSFLNAYATNFISAFGEVGLERVGDFVPGPKFKTPFMKRVTELTHMNSFPGEMLEENLQTAWHALFQTGEGEWADLVDTRNQLVTAGTIGLMQLPGGAIESGGYAAGKFRIAAQKRSINKGYQQNISNMHSVFGDDTQDILTSLDETLSSIEDSSEAMLRLVASVGELGDNLNEKQQDAVVNYGLSFMAMKGLEKAKAEQKAKAREDVSKNINENYVNQNTGSVVLGKVAGVETPVTIQGNVVFTPEGKIDTGKSGELYYIDSDGKTQVVDAHFVDLVDNTPAEQLHEELGTIAEEEVENEYADDATRLYEIGEEITYSAGGDLMGYGTITGIAQDGKYIVTAEGAQPFTIEPRKIIPEDNLKGVANGVMVEYMNDNGDVVVGEVQDSSLRRQGVMIVDNQEIPTKNIIGVEGTTETQQWGEVQFENMDNSPSVIHQVGDELTYGGDGKKHKGIVVKQSKESDVRGEGYYVKDENGNHHFVPTGNIIAYMPASSIANNKELEQKRKDREQQQAKTPEQIEAEKLQQQAEQEKETFLQSLPVNNKGEIDQKKMTTAQTMQYFEYQYGVDETLKAAEQQVKNKERQLKSAQTALSNDPFNIAKREKVDAVQSELEEYKAYVFDKKKEMNEQRAQTSTSSIAAEKQAQEQNRAEAKQQEQAQQAEIESLQGIPDVTVDNAQNARARGYRSVNGERVNRQEPITPATYTETERKFSDKEVIPVKRSIVEAETLQPSHKNGVRNNEFFITEAQPKERTDSASQGAAESIASNINPVEITGGVTAYTGAPIVNSHGEVLQGNNRVRGLQLMHESNKESADKYKQHLIDNAADYGMTAEQVKAMNNPVAVDVSDVSDADAIRLGQLSAADTESGGTQRIPAKQTSVALGEDTGRFSQILFESSNEDAPISVVIERNGKKALDYLRQKKVINPTQYQSALDRDGNINPEAKKDLQDIASQMLFENANSNIEQMFDALPDRAQKAILQTIHRDANSPKSERIVKEIQSAIEAYSILRQNAEFENAVDYKNASIAAKAARGTTVMFNSETDLPLQKYSSFAMELAILFKADTQKALRQRFNNMYDNIQGVGGDAFNAAEKLSAVEAIKKHFNNIDYVPNGQTKRNDVAGDSKTGGKRQQAGTRETASGERTADGKQPTDSGAGTDADNKQRGESRPKTDVEVIRKTIEELSVKLNTPITIYNSAEEIPAGKNQARQAKSKGWYVQSTGKVFINAFNATSVEDAKQSVVHEVVAHKGLRDMLGEKKHAELMMAVFDALPREYQNEYLKKYKNNPYIAADEYIAYLSENEQYLTFQEQGQWQKIKEIIVDFIEKHLDIKLNKENVNHVINGLLVESKKRLENLNKGEVIDIVKVAQEVAKAEQQKKEAESQKRTPQVDIEAEIKRIDKAIEKAKENKKKESDVILNSTRNKLKEQGINDPDSALADISNKYEAEIIRLQEEKEAPYGNRKQAKEKQASIQKMKAEQAKSIKEAQNSAIEAERKEQEKQTKEADDYRKTAIEKHKENILEKWIPTQTLVGNFDKVARLAKEAGVDMLSHIEAFAEKHNFETTEDSSYVDYDRDLNNVLLKPIKAYLELAIAKQKKDTPINIVEVAKETVAKQKIAEAQKELDASIDDFMNAFNDLNSENLGFADNTAEKQAKMLMAGTKVVANFTKLNVLKFSDMVNQLAQKGINVTENLLSAIKKAYGAFVVENDIEGMDDIKTVREFKLTDIKKSIDGKEQGLDTSELGYSQVEKQAHEMTLQEYRKKHISDLDNWGTAKDAIHSTTSGMWYAEMPNGGQTKGSRTKRNLLENIIPFVKKQSIEHIQTGSIDWMHKAEIEKALSEGKTIPESVLKEYPELSKKQPKERLESLNEAIENAAQEVDVNPSEAQKEAGNYKKGHITINGLDITLENPKGTQRKGVDQNGKKWSITMNHHYGYFKQTESLDGDHIDVFIGESHDSDKVFVVDQVNKDGSFDEHKVMMSFDTIEQAKEAYLSNYEDGWHGLGAINEATVSEFRDWAKADGRRVKGFAEYKQNGKDIQESKKGQPINIVEVAKQVATNEKTTKKEQPTEKIEDFGEVIEGAKKHTYQRIETSETDMQSQPLSKTFPKPNYSKLVEDGVLTKKGAMVLKHAYEALPSKPRKKYRIAAWVKEVEKLIATYNSMIENKEVGDSLHDNLMKLDSFDSDYSVFVEIQEAFGFPENDVNMGTYRVIPPNRVSRSTGIDMQWLIVKGNSIVGKAESAEGIARVFNQMVDKNKKKGVALSIYRDTINNKYFIGRKTGGGIARLVDGMTREEAIRMAKEEMPKLQEMWEARKVKPEERRKENRKRVGTDYRKGKDVTEIQFGETFGFRGVQFGNWVNNVERQESLNDAYDAFMDLSNAIGVSPRALSLAGELGMAFGARGSGNAMAHYESGEVVINLTKTKGAGSLAHEWWHAMDSYFSRMRGEKQGFLTESPRQKYKTDGGKRVLDTSIRTEMHEAFLEVMSAINNSDLPKRSKELDKARSNAYWATQIEMSARAFEGYIIDKLGKTGEQNDYLANFKEISEWVSSSAFDMKNYPYPTVNENAAINEAFESLFDIMQEKEEDGKQILYRDNQDFRDGHGAPAMDYDTLQEAIEESGDVNLSEMITGKQELVPDDFFDTRMVTTKSAKRGYAGAIRYGYNTKSGIESVDAIKALQKKIKDGVNPTELKAKAYRAIPNTVDADELIDGDWVTLSKDYAEKHGLARFGKGEYKIIEQDVPVNKLWWDGNDINELGYDVEDNIRYREQTESPQFKEWFGESKVVDAEGQPKAMYHQTTEAAKDKIYNEGGFKRGYERASKHDFETPYGHFFKSSKNNIGVDGNTQIETFIKMENPFYAKNREDLTWIIETESPAYKKLTDEIKAIDKKHQAISDAQEKVVNDKYREYEESGLESKEEKDACIEEVDKWGELNKEWSKEYEAKAIEAKDALSEWFKGQDYDGVIIRNDQGSFGRTTDTYIVFNPNQIKSATDNIGTFDAGNNDIRYREGRPQFSDAIETVVERFVDRVTLKENETQKEAPNLKELVFFNDVKDYGLYDKYEIVPVSNPVVNIQNLNRSIYGLGAELKPLNDLHSQALLNFEGDTGYLNQEKVKEFSNKFEGAIEPYETALLKTKHFATEAAQREIMDIIKDIDHARDYYERLSKDHDVLRSEREPRFRDAESISELADMVGSDMTEQARKEYDAKYKKFSTRFREAWEDQFIAVKDFLDLLRKNGLDIEEYNDFYKQATFTPGKNDFQLEHYKDNYQHKITMAVNALENKGFTYREIENYVFAKHGIERNEFMRRAAAENFAEAKREPVKQKAVSDQKSADKQLENDKITQEQYDKLTSKIKETETKQLSEIETAKEQKYQEMQSTDFAGLTALAQEVNPEGVDAGMLLDDMAQWHVEEFESNAGESLVDGLWESIKKATDYSLDNHYKSGGLSRDAYTELKGRYENFVPLRGHDAEVAEDKWNYSHGNMGTFYTGAIIKADGRKTRAESPFAYIGQMAHSSIMRSTRNTLNQTLLRLAHKDKSGLMNVKRTWYVNKGTIENPLWEMETAEFNDNPEAYIQNQVDFEERMKQLSETGMARQSGKGLDIGGLFIKPKQAEQHEVQVDQNGVHYTIYINANPAVARAINGDNTWSISKGMGIFGTITRNMAANFTTRNPLFIARNASRDYIFANTMLAVKENAKYTGQFNKNIPSAFAALTRQQRGKMNLNEQTDMYLYEFMMNGGRTGFTQMLELNKMAKQLEREAKKGDSKNIIDHTRTVLSAIDVVNDVVENATRFAVYMTSRKEGRSVIESVHNAKNVTVNFNQKGAGISQGNSLEKVLFGAAGVVRPLYLFTNAAVQSLSNFSKAAGNHPGKMSIAIASYMMYGFMAPMIAGMIGGDEGEEDFMKQSEWDRQNNWSIGLPNGFIKIPLPHELRVFHRLGDNVYQAVKGNKDILEVLLDMTFALSDLLPMNPLGSADASRAELSPDFARPFAQHETNTNFMGTRIFNEWANPEAPGYTKVTTNKKGEPYAPQFMIDFFKFADNATGGDGVKKGGVSPNPDVVNHYLRGYFGGLYTLTEQSIGMLQKGIEWGKTGELNMKVRDTPIRTFYTNKNDLNISSGSTGQEYYKIFKEAKEVRRREKGYNKKVKDGEMSLPEYSKKLKELDWWSMNRIWVAMKNVKALEAQLPDLIGEAQKSKEKEIFEQKKKIVEMRSK